MHISLAFITLAEWRVNFGMDDGDEREFIHAYICSMFHISTNSIDIMLFASAKIYTTRLYEYRTPAFQTTRKTMNAFRAQHAENVEAILFSPSEFNLSSSSCNIIVVRVDGNENLTKLNLQMLELSQTGILDGPEIIWNFTLQTRKKPWVGRLGQRCAILKMLQESCNRTTLFLNVNLNASLFAICFCN